MTMMSALFFYAKILYMNKFVVKKVDINDIEKELENIGFDKSYLSIAQKKYRYLDLKIFDLSLPQANILKQTALTVGADCAVHRDILTAQVEKTDCILGGSFSQIKNIAEKLRNQPFSMKKLADILDEMLKPEQKVVPKLMGILNVTQNSFSDGGQFYDFDNAIEHLHKLIEEGADVIDIGAESTKPFSKAVSAEEQLEKIEPILLYIHKNNINVPISIDTRSSAVAQRAIDLGATIINDVSGFDYDKKMIEVIANSGKKVIIQHSQGNPETMQVQPTYENVVDEIYFALKNKIEMAEEKGINKDNIIIDVGIGFGKTKAHNFELIRRIEEFKSLGCEIMLGISRKSLLDMKDESNEVKDIYTTALSSLAIARNVDFLRVHNVEMHKKLIELMKNF